MEKTSSGIIESLKEFDSATVFNAVVELQGASQGGRELEKTGGQPECYAGPEMTCMLPELGRAVGYAVTCEVTPLDTHVAAISWDELYDVLENTPGPIVAVYKDVDSRPGRAASFGDGMAATHKMLGVTGVVLEGSLRDLTGIERVGLPVWATGQVPGHGVFSLLHVNTSITVARLRINPGELIVADADGVTKIPPGLDVADVLGAARKVRDFEARLHNLFDDPDVNLAKVREWLQHNS